MAFKAPGKHFREGLSVKQFFRLFPDDKAAEAWFAKERWPEEVCCPYCGSVKVNTKTNHKSMPYRCKETKCRKWFSVKTGTPMQSSKLGYQDWLYVLYCMATNLKSVSSMKMHRDLEITQKSAWFAMHRARHVWNTDPEERFEGPTEADTTHIGGKRKNKPLKVRAKLEGRGAVDMTTVVGIKDRKTNQVRAKVVPDEKGITLRGFVYDHTEPEAKVYTDDASAYERLPNHDSVNHSRLEYVKGEVHTNGIESFWSMLKRSHTGTFHKLSPKHLDRYVGEFYGRHNMRGKGTLSQLAEMADRLIGQRLRYSDLTADNGLPSGARS